MLWHILNIYQFRVYEDRDWTKGLMEKYFEQEMWVVVPDVRFSAAEHSDKNQSRKSNGKRRTVERAAGNPWLHVSNRDKG